MKATVKGCQIDPNKWEVLASDCSFWRHETRKEVSTEFEADPAQEQKRKREVRKSSNTSINPSFHHHLKILSYHVNIALGYLRQEFA